MLAAFGSFVTRMQPFFVLFWKGIDGLGSLEIGNEGTREELMISCFEIKKIKQVEGIHQPKLIKFLQKFVIAIVKMEENV